MSDRRPTFHGRPLDYHVGGESGRLAARPEPSDELAAIVARDAATGEWMEEAGYTTMTSGQADRRALLVLLRETREALTQIAALPPLGPFRIVSDELAAAQAIARAALAQPVTERRTENGDNG